MDAVLYLHGKGGSAAESERYRALLPESDVIGLDYHGSTPWEVGVEIRAALAPLKARYTKVDVIANSIGAYFCMDADVDSLVRRAFFISPIVDMEKLILDIMAANGVTEEELATNGIIALERGEPLSWEYLQYVRRRRLAWNVPTWVLYGSADALVSYETIAAFAQSHNAELVVMPRGEHWFHTDEQLGFLDEWIQERV